VTALHFGLPFTTVPLARAFANLSDRTSRLALDGQVVPVLDVPTHVVHLALHAAQNRFAPDHRSFDEWRRVGPRYRPTVRAGPGPQGSREG